MFKAGAPADDLTTLRLKALTALDNSVNTMRVTMRVSPDGTQQLDLRGVPELQSCSTDDLCKYLFPFLETGSLAVAILPSEVQTRKKLGNSPASMQALARRFCHTTTMLTINAARKKFVNQERFRASSSGALKAAHGQWSCTL
jgi:hypothetical protein